MDFASRTAIRTISMGYKLIRVVVMFFKGIAAVFVAIYSVFYEGKNVIR